MDLTFDQIFEICREGVKRQVNGESAEPPRVCRDCGKHFHSEGSVVMSLDKILCVPCIGAALSRITG